MPQSVYMCFKVFKHAFKCFVYDSNVILSAYGDSKDSLYNKEIMERVIELIKIPDFDEKNVN